MGDRLMRRVDLATARVFQGCCANNSQVSLADLTLAIYARRRQFAPSALVDLPFLPSSIV
jgi:hypothetical protein